MRKSLILILVLLCVPGAAHPQQPIARTASVPPKVPGVINIRVGEIVSVEIESAVGKDTAWRPGFPPEECFVDEGRPWRANTIRLIVSPKRDRVFRIVLWTIGEGREGSAELVIDAGGTPAPPVPPGPEPIPPKPEPPKPIPVVGFRVLIITEKQETLTKGQVAAVYSQAVRNYLNAKTVKDGALPSWRHWDKDVTDPKSAPEPLRLLWEAVRPKLVGSSGVAIAVNNQVTVYPIPDGEAAMLALLKQHAGE